MDERSAVIKIGEQDYELLLTTRATKLIVQRFGGLEEMGEQLNNLLRAAEGIETLCWLITLLANQPICIHNLWHPEQPKKPLTEEAVELLTTPYGLADYKDAIMLCMMKGTKRHVQSEINGGDEGKNTAAS